MLGVRTLRPFHQPGVYWGSAAPWTGAHLVAPREHSGRGRCDLHLGSLRITNLSADCKFVILQIGKRWLRHRRYASFGLKQQTINLYSIKMAAFISMA